MHAPGERFCCDVTYFGVMVKYCVNSISSCSGLADVGLFV